MVFLVLSHNEKEIVVVSIARCIFVCFRCIVLLMYVDSIMVSIPCFHLQLEIFKHFVVMTNEKFKHVQLSVKIRILYGLVIFILVMNNIWYEKKKSFIWGKKPKPLCFNHPGQKCIINKYSQFVACVLVPPDLLSCLPERALI